MLHIILEKGPWFRPKSYGFGSGLPIKWQGWLLLLVHIAVMAGLALWLQDRPLALLLMVIPAALAPMPLYAARTEGGWRWRWGEARTAKGQKRPK